MATQIHAFGPNGELSPGAAAALEGLGGGVGGGSTTVQIGTLTLPASPAQGQSVSVLADSTTVLPEDVTWDSGGEPVITERMLLVFVWSGTDWVGTYGLPIPAAPVPPDETGPTAGTLGVVVTSTTADGTVTGATDETELHATPYSFRIDAGTWSAWQAGATYEWTGLTASTSYDFQHRVRDAAGNITEGSVVTDTTDAASADTTDPTPGTLASSSITSSGFTLTVSGASDETALHATPYAFSTDNGGNWSAYQAGASFDASGLTAETEYTCVHRVRDAAGNVATGSSITVETEAAPSGVFFTDFSEYTTGVAPADWAEMWNSGNYTATIAADGAATGGKVFRATVSFTARNLLYWSAVPVSANQELVMKYRLTTAHGSGSGQHLARLRGSGSEGAENSYHVSLASSSGQRQLLKYVAGAQTTLDGTTDAMPTTWHWLRLRANGNQISYRIWEDGGSEPGTWMYNATDSSLSTGRVGLGLTLPNTIDVDVFGVDTAGGTAPKVAP